MAARTVATATVNGSAALRKKLLDAGPKKLRPACRSAAAKAGRVVAKAAKPMAAKRTGSLAKAIGSKVAARKKTPGFVAIVGPRRDSDKVIARSVAAVAAGKRKKAIRRRFARMAKYQGREIKVDPVKYAHLVEFGRKAVGPTKRNALSFTDRPAVRKKAKAAAPKPFLGPAWRGSEAHVRAVVETTLAEAVRKLGGGA